jgi:hypothetical protein
MKLKNIIVKGKGETKLQKQLSKSHFFIARKGQVSLPGSLWSYPQSSTRDT